MSEAEINYQKPPPIGVMPKRIWQEHRAMDLSKAIDRSVAAGRVSEHVIGWADELVELLKAMKEGA